MRLDYYISKKFIRVEFWEAKTNVYDVLSVHIKNNDNQLITEIISGPAKGTKIITLFEKNDSGSRVSFQLDLKLNLKAKILQPLIIKYYKMVLTSVLYKMNSHIIELESK